MSTSDPMAVELSPTNQGNGTAGNNETAHLPSTTCTIKFIMAETPISLTVGFILNIIAVTMLTRVNRHFPSRILRLTILLSSNDMLGCGTFLLSMAINTFTCDKFQHNQFCNVLGMVGYVSFLTSLNIVVLLSVERFMQVHSPLFSLTRWSKVTTMSFAVSGLTADLLLAILPLLGVGKPYMYYNHNRFCCINMSGNGDQLQRMILFLFAIVNIIRIFMIVVCNISVSVTMRRKSKDPVGTWNSTHKKAVANAKAFIRLTQVIAAVNVILTTPYGILIMKDAITNQYNLDGIEYVVATSLMFVTPLANPVIYVSANKYCRRCLLDIVRCKSTSFKELRNSSTRTHERTQSSLKSLSNISIQIQGSSNMVSS